MRRLWAAVAQLKSPRRFANAEGGSVEQQRDRRLLLHHCANYAAVLFLLRDFGTELRLVELGCGSGVLSSAFARVMPPGWMLIATDYSASLVNHARENYQQGNLSFEQLDVRRPESERLAGADAVFMLEVIEHLSVDAASRLLHDVHGMLRPGARFIITTLDRAAYSRPFSGYPPHVIEYSFQTMNARLADRAWNPFRHFNVCRLVSPRITAEAVLSENRIGYALNRLNRLVSFICRRHCETEELRQRIAMAVFGVYARLPIVDRFDLDAYLETLAFVRDGAETYDRSSFGLVAELVKDR